VQPIDLLESGPRGCRHGDE